MKKLFVMLSLVLCLGMFGCFNNSTEVAEPIQEEAVIEETEAIEADTLCVDEIEAEVEEEAAGEQVTE